MSVNPNLLYIVIILNNLIIKIYHSTNLQFTTYPVLLPIMRIKQYVFKKGISLDPLFNQIKIFVVNENGGLQFGSIVGLQYYKLLRGDTIMNMTG